MEGAAGSAAWVVIAVSTFVVLVSFSAFSVSDACSALFESSDVPSEAAILRSGDAIEMFCWLSESVTFCAEISK